MLLSLAILRQLHSRKHLSVGAIAIRPVSKAGLCSSSCWLMKQVYTYDIIYYLTIQGYLRSKTMFRKVFALTLLVLFAAGCAAPQPTLTPIPPTPTVCNQTVTLDPQHPAVVFEK